MNIDTALGSIFRIQLLLPKNKKNVTLTTLLGVKMTEGDFFYSIENIDNIVSGESSDKWDGSE